jgi:quinol monooxygenase YgiN
MFLRLVQTTIDPARMDEIRRRYAAEIIPEVEKMKGCLYAGLVQNVRKPQEVLSLTLWRQREQASLYVQSGLFRKLLEITRPYFADPSKWELRLTEALELEYAPAPAEPVIREYGDPADEPGRPIPAGKTLCPYFRLVTMLVQSGKVDEFRKLFMEQVLPTLTEVPGCCYVQLVQNVRHANEFASFSVWSTHEAVQNYERGGVFTLLQDVLKPTLSALYQWKMDVEEKPGQVTATSDDMDVQSFVIVAGRSFTD